MPLSPSLRLQLEALLQSYDEGHGPVEREALRRRSEGLSTTPLQLKAFSDHVYPADLRAFLAAHGCHPLFERDLSRALSLGAAAPGSPLVPMRPAASGPRRPVRSNRGLARALRLALLASALGAGWLIFDAAVLQEDRRAAPADDRPFDAGPPAPGLASPAPEPEPEPAETSLCVRLLRESATAWCLGALTGLPSPGRLPDSSFSACGNRLTTDADAVRLALDSLLADNAAHTYSPGEARDRCAAAAGLTAPR